MHCEYVYNSQNVPRRHNANNSRELKSDFRNKDVAIQVANILTCKGDPKKNNHLYAIGAHQNLNIHDIIIE